MFHDRQLIWKIALLWILLLSLCVPEHTAIRVCLHWSWFIVFLRTFEPNKYLESKHLSANWLVMIIFTIVWTVKTDFSQSRVTINTKFTNNRYDSFIELRQYDFAWWTTASSITMLSNLLYFFLCFHFEIGPWLCKKKILC